MKNIKFISALLLLPLCLTVSAQNTASEDSVVTGKLKLAGRLILTNGHERAYQLYTECADAGSAAAMNAVGILKQRGWGTEQDEAGSMEWFRQAAAAGYSKAYYNLFHIYAKALGVEQNFENAVNYLDTLNTMHRSVALMYLGYYHYKGFGVEQNYETAVNFFMQSAEFDNADAFYFLGLCYRNGYGVQQNEEQALEYLNRAAELGHYYSFEELEEESTEITVPPKNIAMHGESEAAGIPRTYRKIEKHNLNRDISGEYTGSIVTYDYSGKNITGKSDLKILFEETRNGRIFGRWIENDTVFTGFEAVLTDSALQFIDTEYIRTERYSKQRGKIWQFRDAVLEITETDGVSYLAGNIRQYDTKLKEPGKPLYVSLQKSRFPSEDDPATENVTVSPNPSDGEINILFSLETEQTVTISVYGVNGILFDRRNLGILQAGRHNYLLTLDAPKGQYLLVLQRGDKKNSNLIIKK